MNQKTIASAERALVDFIKRSKKERDYYSGRLIRAENLPAPDQHMVSAAVNKLNWYKAQIDGLEGELEILREELGIAEETTEEESDSEK